MVKRVNFVPEGFRTISPASTVKNAAEAIAFYKKTFGAVERAEEVYGRISKCVRPRKATSIRCWNLRLSGA